MPVFLDIVDESEFSVKYVPCPVQRIAAPKPCTADIRYSKNEDSQRNDTKNILSPMVTFSTILRKYLKYKVSVYFK